MKINTFNFNWTPSGHLMSFCLLKVWIVPKKTCTGKSASGTMLPLTDYASNFLLLR